MTLKLKHSEIKDYRVKQLRQQNNCCALCGEEIIDDAVLDHDHRTGRIRKVLHRGCNSMLGKIENSMPRSRMSLDRLEVFAGRLIKYMITQHTICLHPTHKTKEERDESIARKRIKNRKKQKETKTAQA